MARVGGRSLAAVVVLAPLLPFVLPAVAVGQCVEQVIRCGETRAGDLNSGLGGSEPDCSHPVFGSPYDSWRFAGEEGQTITAYLRNNDGDEHGVELIDPHGVSVGGSSFPDGGPLDSRLVYTVTERSGAWRLWVNYIGGFPPAQHSGYELTLVCSDPEPPALACPHGFFSSGTSPDFCFQVLIHHSELLVFGAKEGRCHPGTICVSGAVPGRPEVYIRLVGPRPNGRLWPTVARLTTSPVEVDILRLSTGEIRSYRLDEVPRGAEDLPGLQDREGFPP